MIRPITFAVLTVSVFGFGCKKQKPVTPPVTEKPALKSQAVLASSGLPRVEITTDLGSIVIEVDEVQAPISAKNFLGYVDEGFYDGTIFHRVISKFMIQGGGFDEAFSQKPTRGPIKNEADNGLKNVRGAVAMARTSVVDSATAQFFINVVDNAALDHRGTDPQSYGYAVFGRVIQGMDVVDKIKDVPTTSRPPFQDVPVQTLVIRTAKRVK